jgi:hypothetical protein
MRNKAVLTAVLLILSGCDQPDPATVPRAEVAREFAFSHRSASLERCAFGQRFSLKSTNEFFPISVGSEWMLRGEEDGSVVDLRITVLDSTVQVGGVTTRVVREVEKQDDELVEISWNFFAEARDGTVCYFGEDVDIYEDGQVVSHEGAWRADTPGNFPGIIMPAEPRPGLTFQMEGAPGIALDEGKVIARGPVRVPAGSFHETIRIRETNPLDGGVSLKVYAEDVGLLIDGPVSLVRFTGAADHDDDTDRKRGRFEGDGGERKR